LKFEADPKKLAEEIGKLISFFIHHKQGSLKEISFTLNFPELYFRIYVPAKIAAKKK
jgi:hypothetical protein